MRTTGEHTTTNTDSIPDLFGLQLIDATGCLTDGALCFVEEMSTEQRAVVERHLAVCPVCSQQQAELARAARLLRQSRPQQIVGTEVRLLSRRALLRGAARLRQERPRSVAERRVRRRGLWHRHGWLLISALSVGILAISIALLLLR